mmetsp:Transcript_11806/g.24395  ORF Transcript_11806/g.24395 Transcript_11806/m.24395 type:complete len:94 (-) Transcript_11806:56-337(-)
MSSTDKASKDMALAILKELKEKGFVKAAKALEKEILQRFSLESLPKTEKLLVLQPKKKASKTKDKKKKRSKSDSSSSSCSGSDGTLDLVELFI